MGQFFRNLTRGFWRNLREVFSWKNLFWLAVAILLTYILVASGGDWWWFLHTRSDALRALVLPAIAAGTFIPVLVPLYLVFRGRAALGFTLGQAAVIGWLVSSTLKALTGRMPPELATPIGADISHGFQFGLFRGGIFWGWPSSHTTIAFSLAMALVALYPHNRAIRILAPLYALYVAFSVSISIHWLSEAIAGAIIGTVIGMVVGKRLHSPPRDGEMRTS